MFWTKEDADIYDISDDLKKRLSELGLVASVSDDFNQLKQIHAKVSFVEQKLVEYDYMAELKRHVVLRAPKSNKKSTEYRLAGNQQFALKGGNYFQALEYYNKSICYAEPGSENIAFGYANRSAVLFAWQRYRECLNNIDWARRADYPKQLMHKLDKREQCCLKLLHTQADEVKPFDFQLRGPPHEQISTISACVKLRRKAGEGRFLISTEDLDVGDMIATEQPFCTALLPAMRYIRCAHCKEEHFLTLMPCDFCCSSMFCSSTCKDTAWRQYHKYECPLIDLLFTFFAKTHRIALRTALTALALFSNVDEAMSFCADPLNQDKNIFDLDHQNLTPKEHYRAIHGLETNQHIRNPADLFQRSVVCATLKHFLLASTTLGEFLANDEGTRFFIELLFRHLQTSAVNMHSIDLVEQLNETPDDQKHSSGAFPLLSLLNHSCAPNTVRVFRGTKVYLFVLRPIMAGGQLYDNYGHHYFMQSAKERQEQLFLQYRFKCSCEACVGDYPKFEALPLANTVPNIQGKDQIARLSHYDFDFALKNYRKFCNFLTNYCEFYPCYQVSCIEESLKMCLHILVDAVPLKAKVELLKLQSAK